MDNYGDNLFVFVCLSIYGLSTRYAVNLQGGL